MVMVPVAVGWTVGCTVIVAVIVVVCYAQFFGTFMSALWHLGSLRYEYGTVQLQVAILGTL